ncbi:putative disease resistance RPP13-like protein 1 [Vitis vinifera]|nr:putative disease resistance RPP13-like protein 1 [Vitis vinifera]|eukprot:XP_019073356.1 PREDICTED: putative disease resistance RPP13-like protein 1 [Vitis vinifera]
MFVAEAIGSSFLGVLIDKLIASPLLEYARRKKIDRTLEEWRKTLTHIEAVLCDAENKQIREKAVKVWLDDLKSLAYDIEDVIDEFDIEAKQRSLTEGPQACTSKVRKLIPTCGALDPRVMSFNKKMGEKINKITRELDAIAKRRVDLHLKEGVRGVSFGIEERLQTTSLVDESRIHGRDADKEKIIELMLSDEATKCDRVSVISMVGMGGIGKTTLAQIIYNDGRVENRFDMRVWVCVSDDFDVVGITKAILESITKRPCEFKTLELLQEKLKNEMKEKRFFLVLDDVWNENPNHWDVLQAPFNVGARGSVVLVTTRNENVASIMRTTASSYQLHQLTDEQCWLLFAQQAFKNLNSDVCQNLESIGRKIARKCKGLPLAAKTLAGLLRSKQDSTAWNDVLNNEIWDLPNDQSNILPALNLSYYYLPPKLKRCFTYCSIFPKDYVFEKEKLVLLWMAEGFLDSSKREGTVEEFGNICFNNLLSRSFFQRYYYNESVFVMHDLIHDLAQFISGRFCCRLEDEKQNKISKEIRHFSYSWQQGIASKKFKSFLDDHNLQTFLPQSLGTHGIPNFYLSKEVSHCLLSTLMCLRVLSLTYYGIKDLPHSIGNLKHLRYLDLSHNLVRTLPKSITTLFNLQTLMLSWCEYLVELPTKMGRLINLRHLKIDGTKLERMPMEMSRMKNLRTLTTFVVSKHTGSRVGELRDLSHLSGTLAIFKLQNVVDARDALESNMKRKECLDKLELNWEDDNAIAGDSQDAASVLEKLQPHDNLKELSIGCYYGAKFPSWLGDPSFINMVSLQLSNCKNCASLPPLGQLRSLQNLSIVKNDVLRKVGQEFYGNGPSSFKPFGSLQTLVFKEMSEWEEWDCFGVEGGEFPCLNELHIECCAKLKGDLPKHLPLLTNLVILECGQLVCQLPKAPSIQHLNLKECDKVVLRSAVHMPSLTELEVSNICSIQVELPPILHKLTSLRKLVIKECQNLSSLPEMGLPSMLEILEIKKCGILETLPEGMIQNNTRLQKLSTEECDSLTSFPSISSLKSLEIKQCGKVELPLPEETTHSYYPWLTSLHIDGSCDSLTYFPLAFFTKLETLYIWGCTNLESLDIPDGLHNMDLTSLPSIHIQDCPNLVSFPQGGLPASNLRQLRIGYCNKLKSLPQRMHTLLTSLEDLEIYDCPEIVSFPEGGLPTNLSSLEIWNCYKLMESQKEWGIQTLPSLRKLSISGDTEEGSESFFEEWLLLPSTLISLQILNFPDLKSLDNLRLQNLTSLQTLRLYKCFKLKSFPTQGLPSSLSILLIRDCPLLIKRCQRDKGKEWPKIAHIPYVVMDGEVISS